MNDQQSERFEEWAIVEVMGHRRFAGLVTEQAIGGASFVRIDIPEARDLPAFTKLFGGSSIYCITPCTEATVIVPPANQGRCNFLSMERRAIKAPTPVG